MPDSLIFDGTDDKLDIGSVPPGIGYAAMTILFIVKFDTYTNYPQILTWNSLDGGLMLMSDNSIVAGDFGAGSDVSPFLLSGTSWQLIGYGKATGSATPRYHRYVWDTATWTHGPGFNPISNFPQLATARIGDSIAVPGQNFDGNMLIGGIWNSNLTDPQVETLITGFKAWLDSSPISGWRFDSSSQIDDFIGVTRESSRTGTTLGASVAPAGWVDEPAGGVDRTFFKAGADNAAASSMTDSLLLPAEMENGLLLVAIHNAETGDNVTSVKYNSIDLTELHKAWGTSWAGIQFWYLLNPPGGFTANLVTTFTGSGLYGRQVAHAFSGVDQTNPFREFLENAGSAALSNLPLSSAVAGDFLVDAITIDAIGHAARTSETGQLEDYDDPISTACDTAGSTRIATGSSDTIRWAWTTSAPYAHIGIAIRPVGAGPPQLIRPDADVTTTGWTTAPLFSKVDEAVTDDADFITSTAS